MCIRFCLHFQTDHSEIMISGMFCLSESKSSRAFSFIRRIVFVQMKLNVKKNNQFIPTLLFTIFFIINVHMENISQESYTGVKVYIKNIIFFKITSTVNSQEWNKELWLFFCKVRKIKLIWSFCHSQNKVLRGIWLALSLWQGLLSSHYGLTVCSA